MAVKRRWPTAAAGVARLPAHWTVHYGGAWATRRADILELGGHDLTLASFRNADARLGNRMVRAGLESYITFTDDAAAYHLGHTHHSRRQHHDRSRGPTLGQKIANGGRAYWTSDACRQSFRELESLDSQPRQATM